MIQRRELLQMAPVASLVSTFAGSWSRAFGAAAHDGEALLSRAIADARFPDSVAFSNATTARGIPTTRIGDDVARLWYDDLRAELRRTALPFAGMTQRAALFCLEELARDVNMKVVARIDHVFAADETVQHTPVLPESAASPDSPLLSGAGFGRDAAALVMRHPWHKGARGAAQKLTGPSAPAGTIALVTWVIA